MSKMGEEVPHHMTNGYLWVVEIIFFCFCILLHVLKFFPMGNTYFFGNKGKDIHIIYVCIYTFAYVHIFLYIIYLYILYIK